MGLGEKMRKIITVGVMTAAATGIGEKVLAQKNNPDALKQHKIESPSVKKVYTNIVDLKKDLNKENKNKLEQVRAKILATYDKQAEWIKSNMASSEYHDRLTKNEQMSEEQYKKRNDLFEKRSKDYIIEDDVSESHRIDNERKGISDNSENTDGYTEPMTGRVHLPLKINNENTVGIHEFEHSATRGNFLMSKYAKNLYNESFVVPENLIISDSMFIKYMQDPTERDARKKQLEYDMEQLGIKKYGEKFTQETYKNLIEAMKSGKLSEGAKEFLMTTKPEYLDKILNTIAFNNINSSQDTA